MQNESVLDLLYAIVILSSLFPCLLSLLEDKYCSALLLAFLFDIIPFLNYRSLSLTGLFMIVCFVCVHPSPIAHENRCCYLSTFPNVITKAGLGLKKTTTTFSGFS